MAAASWTTSCPASSLLDSAPAASNARVSQWLQWRKTSLQMPELLHGFPGEQRQAGCCSGAAATGSWLRSAPGYRLGTGLVAPHMHLAGRMACCCCALLRKMGTRSASHEGTQRSRCARSSCRWTALLPGLLPANGCGARLPPRIALRPFLPLGRLHQGLGTAPADCIPAVYPPAPPAAVTCDPRCHLLPRYSILVIMNLVRSCLWPCFLL